MRLPKRGEKGFTLIELLIVVAILGVLAAVVIPNVTRFVGAGEQEAAETELHNIQLAVTSMMLENGITTIPHPLSINDLPTATPAGEQTNLMTEFPDFATTFAERDALEGLPTGHLSQDGYVLFNHQLAFDSDEDGIIEAIDDTPKQVNYVTVDTTTYFYTCQADGTIQQWDSQGAELVWD